MNRLEDRARRSSRLRLAGAASVLSLPISLPVCLLALAFVAACAAPPDKYTAEQITQAASAGTLSGLYDSIATDLASGDFSDAQRRTMELQLAEAGRMLAQDAEKSIQQAVTASTPASGLAPLSFYEAQEPLLKKLERWDVAVYQRVSADLNTGKQKTTAAIAAAEKKLAAIPEGQDEQRLPLYQELETLYGEGSEKQKSYAVKSEAAVAQLRTKANQAIASEDYTNAQRMLSVVAAVDPENAAVEGTLVEVDAKLFEQRFYEALEKERPDDAYQALVTLAKAPNFDKVRPRLVESGGVMADYFVKLGGGATASGRWADAYRWFSQARDIRDRLDLPKPGALPEEGPFVDEMYRRYQKANGKQLYGLAWGYLNVIDQLQPDAMSLRRDLRETREKVLQQAVKRLSAAPFADQHKGEAKFGDTLTAKIVQYLFENLSEDIRIIEREKLEGIEKERGLAKDTEALLAVDYLVEGNILEAKVDSSERELNQRKRVVTGKETLANPEWDRWNSMDDDERERAGLEDQPPRTIDRDREEDIQIATTYHRKVGVISVSYRVIEAQSAKVIFADTQRTKRELEDTDTDGIELGNFKQEAKMAELPSDVEILDALSEEVSAAIGAKLAEVFVNPEVRYANDAERFVREGNYLDASQQYAYAVVLCDRKERDSEPWKVSLRTTAVAAGID